MRLLPQSLFGRLVLVLFGGLIVAQLLSATINFVERDRLLLRASGMQPAQRIADIVRLLDSLSAAERSRIVAILNVPPQVVSLDIVPLAAEENTEASFHSTMFTSVLRNALGDERPIRVAEKSRASLPWQSGYGYGRHHRAMMEGNDATSGMHRSPGAGGGMGGMSGKFFLTQVRLQDGSWVTFDTYVPQEAASLPMRLLLTLTVLLLAVLLISFVAVRWITHPLHVLASAADELGKDINRSPLPEEGPSEVKRAAHAFNTMQTRLARFIQDRSRILTAMSHDLKTPITRMRLRAELLEDEDLRSRFEKDLKEMEVMVAQTLDFMRGLEGNETPQPVDIMALLESLQADSREMGRDVTIEGCAVAPYVGIAPLLKRCLSNLLDNAILYGRQARVVVEDTPQNLTLRIVDQGPGIAENELEKVFEPFYRLEASRSRETGGTGLGLTIARNIAQTHGGELSLRNCAQGGVEAVLSLPRK